MTQPAGFRDWARLVFGPEYGDEMADDHASAVGRAMDHAIFHGTETPPMQPNVGPWAHLDGTPCPSYYATRPTPSPGNDWWCTEHQQYVRQATDDYVPTEAERLGLMVGAAYGEALAERDQARALVQTIGAQYAEALTHLEAVLDLAPGVSTFAHDDDTLQAARWFLTRAVESSSTPEQEL